MTLRSEVRARSRRNLTFSHSHTHILTLTLSPSPPPPPPLRSCPRLRRWTPPKQEIAAYYKVNYRDFLSHRKRLKHSGDTTKAWDRLCDAFRSHCTNLKKKKGEKRKLEYKDEWPN